MTACKTMICLFPEYAIECEARIGVLRFCARSDEKAYYAQKWAGYAVFLQTPETLQTKWNCNNEHTIRELRTMDTFCSMGNNSAYRGMDV